MPALPFESFLIILAFSTAITMYSYHSREPTLQVFGGLMMMNNPLFGLEGGLVIGGVTYNSQTPFVGFTLVSIVLLGLWFVLTGMMGLLPGRRGR